MLRINSDSYTALMQQTRTDAFIVKNTRANPDFRRRRQKKMVQFIRVRSLRGDTETGEMSYE